MPPTQKLTQAELDAREAALAAREAEIAEREARYAATMAAAAAIPNGGLNETAGQVAAREFPPGEREFIVTAAMIVVQVGPKGTNTQRFARGTYLPEKLWQHNPEGVEHLIELGAIALNDGLPKKALNARDAAKFAGQAAATVVKEPVDLSRTDDHTADPAGLTEQEAAPDLVHMDAEDAFGTMAAPARAR